MSHIRTILFRTCRAILSTTAMSVRRYWIKSATGASVNSSDVEVSSGIEDEMATITAYWKFSKLALQHILGTSTVLLHALPTTMAPYSMNDKCFRHDLHECYQGAGDTDVLLSMTFFNILCCCLARITIYAIQATTSSQYDASRPDQNTDAT